MSESFNIKQEANNKPTDPKRRGFLNMFIVGVCVHPHRCGGVRKNSA
jgi:hypothetical protein